MVLQEEEKVASWSLYTDGACRGNPGPGGWAWATADGTWESGAEAHTTNQRMEIRAVLEALSSHRKHLERGEAIEIASDSTYVVNCFRDRWWQGWERRGWRNAKGAPVANQDLWRPLLELVTILAPATLGKREADGSGWITFRWVKGHSGDPMNELVDRLATEAADLQRGDRSGSR